MHAASKEMQPPWFALMSTAALQHFPGGRFIRVRNMEPEQCRSCAQHDHQHCWMQPSSNVHHDIKVLKVWLGARGKHPCITTLTRIRFHQMLLHSYDSKLLSYLRRLTGVGPTEGPKRVNPTKPQPRIYSNQGCPNTGGIG